VCRVIRYLSDNKAKGNDSWSIPELRALTRAGTDALAQFLNEVEKKIRRPRTFPGPIIALLDKPSALDEGELRPIAILQYIYRIWMAVRKADTKEWTRNMHDGAFESAESHAWNLAAKAELARHEGLVFMAAFLDCVKCYEVLEHQMAYDATIAEGCDPAIADLSFDM